MSAEEITVQGDAPVERLGDQLKRHNADFLETYMPDEPLTAEQVLDEIESAHEMVCDLCTGKKRWVMSIPAQPDRDPDLVIGLALQNAAQFIRSIIPKQTVLLLPDTTEKSEPSDDGVVFDSNRFDPTL